MSIARWVILEIPAGLHAEVTFSRDIAPILYKRCVAIKEAVLSNKMPPWKTDPQYGQWSNDPRLSDFRDRRH